MNRPLSACKRPGTCAVFYALSGLAWAEEPPATRLEPVTVLGQQPQTPAYIATVKDDPATVYRVGQDGVDLFGGPGASNPYRVVNRLPSVYAPTADAYGLVNIPGGTKGLRVRGELSTHGGGGTIDGIPLTGINPGPGNQWLFDMENIAAVSLRQGPIASDRSAFFTTGGVLDSEILWPKAHSGVRASQSGGSYALLRSYARADSGQLADGSAFFVSASYTEADKWRGPGESPSGRSNVEAAWTRPFGEQGKAKLFFSYNNARANNYRPLTYAQAKNLDAYYDYDYSSRSSATPATAVNYYDYNRQNFENWVLFGEFEYAFSPDSKLMFKPYYLSENGEYWDGMANGKVRQWLIDHDWYGMTAEWQGRWGGTLFKAGTWNEASDPPGPPTAWKLYNPNAAGGLGGASWSILADPTNRHYFNSFYAMAESSFNNLKVEVGSRYTRETIPGINFHNTARVGDVSYQQALAQSSGVVANRSVGSFVVGEFLPFIALQYALTPALDLKLSLGRNYGSPAFDVWPVYQQNSAAFLAKGITAKQLWQKVRPETSEGVDVGAELRFEHGYIAPTAYYARFHNKSVSYDPGVGVAYSQNIGESNAYGAQLAAGWTPAERLELFANLSYNRNEFVDDLPLLNGSRLLVSGKQLPDVPEWLFNVGGTWRYGGFSVTPLLRYTGVRYGDTQHTQEIDDYVTTDINLAYEHRFGVGRFGASLMVQNLFDQHYIGFINASYYQLLSNSNAYYYPGAPRSLVGRVSFEF